MIELQLYENMFHVFHTFPFLKEATYAYERAATFVFTQLPESGSDSGVSVLSHTDAEIVPNRAIRINATNKSVMATL